MQDLVQPVTTEKIFRLFGSVQSKKVFKCSWSYWIGKVIPRLYGWWKKGVCLCSCLCMNAYIVSSITQPIGRKDNRLFCCDHTWYDVGMVAVTSASRYVTLPSQYQSRSSMYLRGLIPRNPTKLAEAVPIVFAYAISIKISEYWNIFVIH